jgi:hypothetical protein
VLARSSLLGVSDSRATSSRVPNTFEVVMRKSKSRPEQAQPQAEPPHAEQQQTAEDSGRDTRGRYSGGNAGGPGNPFARRVAQLRAILLETVTDEELRIVAGQLMVKAKFGDLAAIKLLFQYVLGKPAATVNPDAVNVEEVDLYRRAPEHTTMQEILKERAPAELAVDMLRMTLPYVAQGLADAASDAVNDPEAFHEECARLDALDAGEEDFDDEEEEAAEEERQPVGAAPSTNGETNDNPRSRATRPSTNGQFPKAKPQAGTSDNSDNPRRSSAARGPDRRPPRGT